MAPYPRIHAVLLDHLRRNWTIRRQRSALGGVPSQPQARAADNHPHPRLRQEPLGRGDGQRDRSWTAAVIAGEYAVSSDYAPERSHRTGEGGRSGSVTS